jgi:hypothetical protein
MDVGSMRRAALILVAALAMAFPAAVSASPYLSLLRAYLATQRKTEAIYHRHVTWHVGAFDAPRTDCRRLTRSVVDCGWEEITWIGATREGTRCIGTMRVRLNASHRLVVHRRHNTQCHRIVAVG